MSRRTFAIETINRPIKGQKLWYGTATSARRRFEWFAEPDGQHFSIRSEREPGFWMYIRRPSNRVYRKPVLQAIAKATTQKGKA